jgi:hypothetical protein
MWMFIPGPKLPSNEKEKDHSRIKGQYTCRGKDLRSLIEMEVFLESVSIDERESWRIFAMWLKQI